MWVELEDMGILKHLDSYFSDAPVLIRLYIYTGISNVRKAHTRSNLYFNQYFLYEILVYIRVYVIFRRLILLKYVSI